MEKGSRASFGMDGADGIVMCNGDRAFGIGFPLLIWMGLGSFLLDC